MTVSVEDPARLVEKCKLVLVSSGVEMREARKKMGNSLNMDLEGKHVVIKKEILKPEYHDVEKRVFLVKGGFGAKSYTIGTALFGEFVFDGEECRMDGYDVERLASEEEIETSRRLRRSLERGYKKWLSFPKGKSKSFGSWEGSSKPYKLYSIFAPIPIRLIPSIGSTVKT